MLLSLPPLACRGARIHKQSVLTNLTQPANIARRVALWHGCLDSQANMEKLKGLLAELRTKSWKLFLRDSSPCHFLSPMQHCYRCRASPASIACARPRKCCNTCRQRLVNSKRRQGMQRLERARALQNLVCCECATHEQLEKPGLVNNKWPSILSTSRTASVSMCDLGVPGVKSHCMQHFNFFWHLSYIDLVLYPVRQAALEQHV